MIFRTIEECKVYLRSKNLKKGVFFLNEIKGNFFLTLEPTEYSHYDSLVKCQTRVKVNFGSNRVNCLVVGKHFCNETFKNVYNRRHYENNNRSKRLR